MSNLNYYRVICEEINLVLLIKKLSLPQERRAYNSLKRKISTLEAPITIDSYMILVINNFLCDPEEFFEELPQSDDRLSVIKAVYTSIIDAYPPFDLSVVCADINNTVFMEGMEEVMGAFFEHLTKSPPSPVSRKRRKMIKTLGDVTSVEKYLKKHLIGQEDYIKRVSNSVKLIASGLYKSASFFFIGPTGVGKTELARLLGEKYSGNFWKINCAEYASSHEYAKLI